MRSRVASIFWVALLVLLCSGVFTQTNDVELSSPDLPDSSAALPAAKYTELEQKISALKIENQVLEKQEKQLGWENTRTQKRVQERQKWVFILEGGQKIYNPLRFISPLLANLGFLFGAAALLVLVIGWPISARKVLSLNYPFVLPTHKIRTDSSPPMSVTAQTIWVFIFILLLVLLAVPAFGQDTVATSDEITTDVVQPQEGDADQAEGQGEESEAVEGESATTAEVQEPSVTPLSAIQPEMNQAVGYINFTPLERALHAIDTVPDDKTIKLTLEPDLLRILIQSARENNHLCIMATADPPTESITEEIRKGSLGYFFIKASLYEAAGKEGVRELLEEGAAPLIKDNGVALEQVPMQGLVTIMLFLASYQSADYVKVMIPIATSKAKQLGELIMILDAAHGLNLSEEYQKVIATVFEQQQKYDILEALFNRTMKHERKDSAAFMVNSALEKPYAELENNINVLRLLDKVADKERVKSVIDDLAADETVPVLVDIANAASDLNVPDKTEALLVKAVSVARNGVDFMLVLDTADKRGLFSKVIAPMAERISSLPGVMGYEVTAASWPQGFAASLHKEEKVSLGVWIAVHLYLQASSSVKARELFESTIRVQLKEIIDSLGAKPRLRLNDMYALVQYYTETKTDGLNTAMDMLVLQRHLRGLSDVTTAQEDPRLLALQMELDQQIASNKRLKEAVASLQEQKSSLAKQETEANGRFMMLVAEITAKCTLLLLALWIAFSRALAAAKSAPGFRFSHFCLTFTETVGFECCCTVILIAPGIVLTLFSQDRLKHQHIMEYAVSSDNVASPVLPAKISPDIPSPPLSDKTE